MENKKIKPMTEGGILSAISVGMALISIYIPLLGTVAALIWPLPVIILVVRHGIRWGVMALVVSAVLISMLVHPLQALSMVVAFGLVGLVIGYSYRSGFGALKSLLLGISASVISKIAVIALGAVIMNVNPLNLQMDMMGEAFSTSAEIYRSAGMSEAEIATIGENFKAGMETVKLLLPVAIVFAGMLDAFLNFILSGRVLRRLGQADIAKIMPFTEWRMPWFVVYLYAFSLIGMYWGSTRELTLLFQISMNVNMFSNVLGFVQGLGLVQYATDRYNLSKFVRAIILVLILTNGMFLQIVGLTGLFDIIFDYRRRFAMRK